MSSKLPILHFNDVYRVAPQKVPGKGFVDVTQFASMLDSIRDAWPMRHDGARDGLVLFSGDLFAPSVESSVTRGTHMVPVINELGPDVAVTGNHEFDFGYPQLTKLVSGTRFPWLLSNIVDDSTSKVPEHLHGFHIIERCGTRIGFIGLVESEWIATVPSWPSNFRYRDMAETAMELSKRLRDPEGEYRCDLIIALTHSRLPNDILLAKQIKALSPPRRPPKFASMHGVDLVLGGHDHFYYVSRGVESWENYERNEEALGAELDGGDVLVVKSGTDFRELTELLLDLEDSPKGSVRRKLIKDLKGKRHETQPSSASSQRLKDILSKTLDSVSETLKKPVLKVVNPLDLHSEVIRTGESSAGNWFADVIHNVYGDMLRKMGVRTAYGVLLCAGALRGDTSYGPGDITLGDIMEILPFDDSIVALELDGQTIWQALEAGLYRWPATEGRFPVVAGFRVTWDSRKPPGQRVLRVALPLLGGTAGKDLAMYYEEVPCDGCERKYVVVTREYMAKGYDGYTYLKGQKAVIDAEQGQMMSTIVQKFLSDSGSSIRALGSIKELEKPSIMKLEDGCEDLGPFQRNPKTRTQNICEKAFRQTFSRWLRLSRYMVEFWRSPTHSPLPCIFCSSSHIACDYCGKEKQMMVVGGNRDLSAANDERQPVVRLAVDGRFKDVGRLDS